MRQLCHDLMQYVAAGLLVAQQPEDGNLDDEVRTRLGTIAEILLDMRELVGSQLDGLPPPTHAVDVVRLVEGCARVAEMTHRCSVVVLSDRAVVAIGDPAVLRRAVANVLDNAGRAATEHGTVTVRVRRRRGHAIVEVVDDGRGFGRIEPRSGQGLSIVEMAMRRCQGRVDIKSRPGAGTRVRLTIPVFRQEGDL